MKKDHAKIFYNAGLICAICLLIVFFAVNPLLSAIKKISADFAQKEYSLDNLYDEWLATQSTEKSLGKIDQKNLEGLFLSSEKSLDFIQQMENIAQKSGINQSIETSGQTETDEKTSKKTIAFQLALTGSFSSFMNFLVYFENLPYLTEITSMQIQKEGGFSPPIKGNSQINAKIDFKVYAR